MPNFLLKVGAEVSRRREKLQILEIWTKYGVVGAEPA